MTYDAPISDIYDPSVDNYQRDTPTLDGIIREAMRQWGLTMRVCLPGYVTAVHGCQQVDVQPGIQARYTTSETPVNIPVILNVPVSMPVGQNYRIKLPVAVGDQGMLVFADRSLDVWSSSQAAGKPVDCGDTRQHHITDAIFVPGLLPFPQQTTDKTNDLVVTAGAAEARWQQAGQFTLAANGQELLDLVGQLAQSVSALCDLLGGPKTQTLTMLGPQPFLASTQALLQQQKSTVDEIYSNLESITGKTP